MSAATAYATADPSSSRARAATNGDVVVAGVIAWGLAAVGALLGLVWQAWATAGPQAEVLGGGKFIPDETEAFIAGDGRFLALTAAVGLLAALGAWLLRPANRGAPVAAGLLVGGLAGALLTELVGHLTGGGSATGRVVHATSGQQFRLTAPAAVAAHGRRRGHRGRRCHAGLRAVRRVHRARRPRATRPGARCRARGPHVRPRHAARGAVS